MGQKSAVPPLSENTCFPTGGMWKQKTSPKPHKKCTENYVAMLWCTESSKEGFSVCLLAICEFLPNQIDRPTINVMVLLAAGVDHQHLFEDHASGARNDRPGLTQVMEFVHAGDVLIFWKLDRLGRSLVHLLSIVTSLKDKQVAFRSLTEGMDTTTPSGELLFHVFGALAR
jgi:hypothetical protein